MYYSDRKVEELWEGGVSQVLEVSSTSVEDKNFVYVNRKLNSKNCSRLFFSKKSVKENEMVFVKWSYQNSISICILDHPFNWTDIGLRKLKGCHLRTSKVQSNRTLWMQILFYSFRGVAYHCKQVIVPYKGQCLICSILQWVP